MTALAGSVLYHWEHFREPLRLKWQTCLREVIVLKRRVATSSLVPLIFVALLVFLAVGAACFDSEDTIEYPPGVTPTPVPVPTPTPPLPSLPPYRVKDMIGSGHASAAQNLGDVGLEAVLQGPDREHDGFGDPVAIDGDTIVVGMPGGGGHRAYFLAAHVYTSSNGEWTHTAALWTGLSSGSAVAIDGGTIVVGAPGDGPGDTLYVFTKPAGGWVTTSDSAKLTIPFVVELGSFVHSVDVAGDTIVVGMALGESAHVFTKPVDGWIDTSTAATLSASGDDRLGSEVNIEGDTIAVGVATRNGHPAVSLFTRPAGGWVSTSESIVLTLPKDIPYPDRYISVGLTNLVAMSGDTVVVGDPYDSSHGEYRGSAHVFTRPTEGWFSAANSVNLTLPEEEHLYGLGTEVAIDGNTILLSSLATVHIFTRQLEGDDFSIYSITSPEANAYDRNREFGRAFGVEGDIAVIGAPFFDEDITGGAYIYRLGPVPDLQVSVTAESKTVYANSDIPYAMVVSNVGTASANAEMLLRMDQVQRATKVETTQGQCTVAGISEVTCNLGILEDGHQAIVTVTANVATERSLDFVTRVSVSSPEVELNNRNNEDSDTITVLDPTLHHVTKLFKNWLSPEIAPIDISERLLVVGGFAHNENGGAHHYWKPDSGWEYAGHGPLREFFGIGSYPQFGYSVALDGDTLLVGVPGEYPPWEFDLRPRGTAVIYPTSGERAVLTNKSDPPSQEFGSAVDIDGDTIVIGDPNVEFGGRAFIFTKPPIGWRSTSISITIQVGGTGRFGYAVAAGSNIVVVGDPDHYGGRGAAFVYAKSDNGWTSVATFTVPEGDKKSGFGHSVAIDGDIIVVGAPGSGKNLRRGGVYVFTRPLGGWGNTTSGALLTYGDGRMTYAFGDSLDIYGDALVVGSKSGAYLFRRESSNWEDTSSAVKFVAPGAASEFHRVALHGNVIGVLTETTVQIFTFMRRPNILSKQPALCP